LLVIVLDIPVPVIFEDKKGHELGRPRRHGRESTQCAVELVSLALYRLADKAIQRLTHPLLRTDIRDCELSCDAFVDARMESAYVLRL
jgi:hypothetical protein